jgi:hypothetical protein
VNVNEDVIVSGETDIMSFLVTVAVIPAESVTDNETENPEILEELKVT